MSIYLNSTFGPPYKKTLRMQYGVVPIYLFGKRDSQTNPFVFQVLDVAITGGTATYTVQLVSGGGGAPNSFPASPQVGQNVSVLGTQTAGGLFNVGFGQVTGSTVSAATGAGTITIALVGGGLATLAIGTGTPTLWAVNDEFTIPGGIGGVGKVTAETGGVPSAIAIVTAGEGYSPASNVAVTAIGPSTGIGLTVTTTIGDATIPTTADAGTLCLEPLEIPDLVDSMVASIPVAQIFTPDDSDNSRCIFAEAKWSGTLPSAATIKLQVANVDEDSRYQVVQNAYGVSPTAIVAQSDSLATIASSAVTQPGAMYQYIMGKFIRAKVTAITGGDSTTGLIVTLFG